MRINHFLIKLYRMFFPGKPQPKLKLTDEQIKQWMPFLELSEVKKRLLAGESPYSIRQSWVDTVPHKEIDFDDIPGEITLAKCYDK